MKLKIYNILTFLVAVLSFCFVSNVYASTYESLNSRVGQNNSYISNSNKLTYNQRIVFTDKYLRDMPEVNNVGFNKMQQKKIETFANSVVLQGVGSSMTDYQKLESFHSWISANVFRYKSLVNANFDKKYDNPFTLIVERYESGNKIFARDNGYAALLVAFIRSQGIPARVVEGYYNDEMSALGTWNVSVSDNTINHVWVEAFVDNKWIMLDPMADCDNFYSPETGEFEDGNTLSISEYFDPTVMELSKTNIAFRSYPGLATYKYITDNFERTRIATFLNYNGNGFKIADIYDPKDSSTWFGVRDYGSKVDSNGHVTAIHWPNDKGFTGEANFSYFTKLNYFALNNNKITGAVFFNNTNLETVSVVNNNISYALIRNAKKLKHFNVLSNPATKIEYCFANCGRRGIVRVSGGGTVGVKYDMVGRNHVHVLKAKANNGYRFVGWYQSGKLRSKNASITLKRNIGYIYVAKFVPTKGTVVEVSISKQKIWYYKNGDLKHSANVVTGTAGIHNTPTGTFKIRSKSRSVYLVGPDYRSYVNFWMPIYADIGLHDATWRSRFGGNIYTYNGSHGCINLPYNTAKWIYNNVPTGTTVKVYK